MIVTTQYRLIARTRRDAVCTSAFKARPDISQIKQKSARADKFHGCCQLGLALPRVRAPASLTAVLGFAAVVMLRAAGKYLFAGQGEEICGKARFANE
ncbi:hypothetical protein [Bradyrhizobium japonicum]|uniref:hypothetical protein n=1 Tax=Bradyrhizobium japonicum TaxID=375 RepID=UPI002714B95E|nr:hypothetical protein [Bradyrhizobium japonicum]WLB24231.1 hypothetical protein QIH95_47545 [Bradyrhizobium japonicum]